MRKAYQGFLEDAFQRDVGRLEERRPHEDMRPVGRLDVHVRRSSPRQGAAGHSRRSPRRRPGSSSSRGTDSRTRPYWGLMISAEAINAPQRTFDLPETMTRAAAVRKNRMIRLLWPTPIFSRKGCDAKTKKTAAKSVSGVFAGQGRHGGQQADEQRVIEQQPDAQGAPEVELCEKSHEELEDRRIPRPAAGKDRKPGLTPEPVLLYVAQGEDI